MGKPELTNEELRQLDAEADAYQSQADAERAPMFTKQHLEAAVDYAKANAWREGQNFVHKQFTNGGMPGHLSEDHKYGLTRGPHFRIFRDWEEADPSTGIQAWEVYRVEPQASVANMLDLYESYERLANMVQQWRRLEVGVDTFIEKVDRELREIEGLLMKHAAEWHRQRDDEGGYE